MKIALLGTGKTGSFVEELHGREKTLSFNRSTPPTLEALKECDVVISFVPGSAFVDLLPLLIESRLPVVSGSTGDVDFLAISETLKKAQLGWIHGNNFSLAMTVVKEVLLKVSKLSVFADFAFRMSESHHAKKVDQPSGTARSWRDWLEMPNIEITSIREGDVVGQHQVIAESPFERISFEHESKDRRLFAHGALWAAERIRASKLEPGLHSFQDFVLAQIQANHREEANGGRDS